MNTLFNLIVADGISGTPSPDEINISDLFQLLVMHTRRYHELLTVRGTITGIQSKAEDILLKACLANNGSREDQEHLVKNYIICDHSVFLYPSPEISKHDIRKTKKLIENGFIHIAPVPENRTALDIYYLNRQPETSLSRSELGQCSVFINIPNSFNVDPKTADKHFKPGLIQNHQYRMAAKACLANPVAIKSVDPLIGCLIQIEDLVQQFRHIIQQTLNADKDATKKLHKLIGLCNLSKYTKDLSELRTREYLELSDVNAVLGWLFEVNHLSREERLNLLSVLCLSNLRVDAVIDYLMESELLV